MISENQKIKKKFNFRFYAELNDFLPEKRKQKEFVEEFKTPVTVQETLLSLGIPLAEIDLVLVNDKSAAFNHKLAEGDRIAVYPVFETFDITTKNKIRKEPLRDTKFILDTHLGKLAKYLRMLGFDTLYRNDFKDDEIIKISCREHRIILTRDKLLLRSDKITHGYYVRAIEKHEQLREIVSKFDLTNKFKSFTRCMTCNSILIQVEKEAVLDKIDKETAKVFNKFFYCQNCDKVFWEGSHFKRMEKTIIDLIT